MNSIVINGISSDTIQGLLIQELPPIIQPPMRVLTEWVDGRAGDITTYLGYDAYDKDMVIGLYGNFDIDAVIKYFASEGDIVFSNEPGKVYKFQTVEQIDYDRLLRYRTARVRFHVQPYKHMMGEPVITTSESSITVTNQGNIKAQPTITIYGTGTIGVYLNNIQIFSIVMNGEYITIDGEAMNAYMGGVLKNRQVTGDYANFILVPGENTLELSGTVTQVEIENYNRWI